MKAIEIDWSKAPKWATGHGVVGLCNSPVWLSQDQYTYVDGQQGGRIFYFDSDEGFRLDEIREVAEKPSPWNGTGLPPIGAVCEHEPMDAGGGWMTVRVLAHTKACGGDVAVFQVGDVVSFSSANYFRPLLTPEQIAAEERERAVDAMMETFVVTGSTKSMLRNACLALYDAGYRKVEGDKQ